ncbi:MAG: helix-turn-helix transcriptional regulator [bacterium]|nr:helix-turn-helix transcriptional regulator [bacterium]
MNKNCTVYRTVDFIGKKWTLLILLELYKGRSKLKRYSRLKKALPGITPKMLSLRLREMEKKKLITKRVDSKKFPVKCEYALTPRGREFIKIIKNIKQWALTWNIDNKTCSARDCRACKL